MLLSSRIRPLNTTEEKTGSKVIVKFPAGSSDDQCISIGVGFSLFVCFSFSLYLLCHSSWNVLKKLYKVQDSYKCHPQGKVYVFDKVLKPNVTQTQVYDSTAKSIVKGLSSRSKYLALQLSWSWALQMCSPDITEPSLRTAKPLVGKPTPWRESLMTQTCRESYQGISYKQSGRISNRFSLFSGLSTTSSITSIQWKKTLSSTSKCPTLRYTWTNAEICSTVSRHTFAQI